MVTIDLEDDNLVLSNQEVWLPCGCRGIKDIKMKKTVYNFTNHE